jgi:hypothetical protein
MSVHFACVVLEANDPFIRSFYDNFVAEDFALNDVPCDASDMTNLNEKYSKDQLKYVKELTVTVQNRYTHIVEDANGQLYAVIIKEGDWTESSLRKGRG